MNLVYDEGKRQWQEPVRHTQYNNNMSILMYPTQGCKNKLGKVGVLYI